MKLSKWKGDHPVNFLSFFGLFDRGFEKSTKRTWNSRVLFQMVPTKNGTSWVLRFFCSFVVKWRKCSFLEKHEIIHFSNSFSKTFAFEGQILSFVNLEEGSRNLLIFFGTFEHFQPFWFYLSTKMMCKYNIFRIIYIISFLPVSSIDPCLDCRQFFISNV